MLKPLSGGMGQVLRQSLDMLGSGVPLQGTVPMWQDLTLAVPWFL